MRQDAKKTLKIILVSLLFIIIVVYAFFRSKDLIFGVKIRDMDIVDGSTMTNNILNITGNAKNALDLTLDGREISIDQQGNFNETIVLLPGYDIITIKAEDKFGNIDEKDYKLIYQKQ
jgi:hypothetical protein